MRKTIVISVLTFFWFNILILQSCSPSGENKEKLKTLDSIRRIDSLNAAQKQYQLDSISAANKKETMDWQKIRLSNSVELYKKYIESYPNGLFKTIALNAIDSLEYIGINSIHSFRLYVKNHPESSNNINSAKKKVRKISFTLQAQKPVPNWKLSIYPVINNEIIDIQLGNGKTDENGRAIIEFYNSKGYKEFCLIQVENETYTLFYNKGKTLTFICEDHLSTCNLNTLIFDSFIVHTKLPTSIKSPV